MTAATCERVIIPPGLTTGDPCGRPATLEARQLDGRDQEVRRAALCSGCAVWLNPEGLTLVVLTFPGHEDG